MSVRKQKINLPECETKEEQNQTNKLKIKQKNIRNENISFIILKNLYKFTIEEINLNDKYASQVIYTVVAKFCNKFNKPKYKRFFLK